MFTLVCDSPKEPSYLDLSTVPCGLLALFGIIQILNIISPYPLDATYNVSHDLRTDVSRRMCANWTATVA